MCRRTATVGSALLWAACLIAMASGCRCGRLCGGCGACTQGYGANGWPPGCDKGSDRYAARPYPPCAKCRAARRDPRIPGPRGVYTQPAPEAAAPSYFHPVPTYPVFGPRSEQPDGIEPQMQPLMPGESFDLDGEPLPPPRLRNRDTSDEEPADDDLSYPESSDLKLTAPEQTVQNAGWRPAKKQPAVAAAPSRPGTKSRVTFRQPSSALE